MNDIAWELFENGHYKEAADKFARAVKRRKDQLAAFNLGLAYLCLDDPQAASAVFDSLLEIRFVTTAHYAMAGVARWVMDSPSQAVSIWKSGIGCQYADAAGGIELPLLWYFAAVRDPKSSSLLDAAHALKMAGKHPWAECWPGPIGAFAVGDLNEADLRQAVSFENDPVRRRQEAQVEFYIGVKALEKHDHKAFNRQMKRCAGIPKWHLAHEYYLARFEAKRPIIP